MTRLMDATERRCKEAEEERKEAVDKIFELRDIIRVLEDQVKSKASAEDELRNIVNELELLVKHQNNQEVTQTAEPSRDVSDVERLHQYVGNLESEVQKLRLSTEIAGSEGALQQIKNHLCDFEVTLDKRTKDLEGLHSGISTTTCSSPSEDMSIRDVVHQDSSIYDECEVPLQQLARLKEKLTRHSRAEDAALKRIRDLELQMLALKSDLEESQSERDILRRQISDHLVLISNLQIRLDEQRIRAEHIEKQTNTSLEVQNYDLKTTITTLEDNIAKRDKTIAQLKANIEETKKRLEDAEREISANKEDEMIIQMQEQLEFLRSENMKLKSKIEKEAQILPNLVENIISDKNSDIEKLRGRLSETENQLRLYASLNLEKEEIDCLTKLRLSGISFHDITELENLEQARRAKVSTDSLVVSPIPLLRKEEKTVFIDSEAELSSIEKIGTQKLFYSLQVPNQKANSTEKHVRFEDETEAAKVKELQKLISDKDTIIRDYENRLGKLEDLQNKVDDLQLALNETEVALKKATETFQEEQKQNEEIVEQVRSDLAARRSDLTQKEDELKACRAELEEERDRALEREKELKTAQKIKSDLKNSLKVKDAELKSHEETLKIQNEELKKLQDEVQNLQTLNDSIGETVKNKDDEITKLKKQNEDVSKEVKHLQFFLAEKDKVIDQMEVDSKSLHVNLETIQNKLQETGNVVDLGRRLREEQKKNSDLYEELHELKAQLLGTERRSLEDITGQVQKELNYSAYLDSSLINAINDGSLENDDLEALRVSLKKQKSINRQLARTKEMVEKKFDELERSYEVLKKELDKIQYEDAILIGELRKKLDRAVESNKEFDRIVKSERSDRRKREMADKMEALLSTSNSLPDVRHEYKTLAKMITQLEEENSHLKQELKRLRDSTNVDVAANQSLIVELESKLTQANQDARNFKDMLAKAKAELEAKVKELGQNRKAMEEVEQERKKLLKQLDQKSKMAEPLTEQLLTKIRELNEVVKNDRQMMGVIERLRNENALLEERIVTLEERRVDHLPFDDPAGRANYLFAKYLRSESYRKALAWQKRYLISLLETYQNEPFPRVELISEEKHHRKRRSENRFKCVATMVISVCRMKYLVRRWHSGKRIVEQRAPINSQVQFQVGQPVSSQNFASNVNKTTKSALNQPKTDLPWFGTSPPCKDLPVRKIFSSQPKASSATIEEEIVTKKQDVGRSGGKHRLTPDAALSSPAMLSKYIERFNQIQDRLGLDTFD